MKMPSAATAAVITLVALAVAAITTSLAGPVSRSAVPAVQDGAIAHGRYLVAIGGCHDCHTPGYASAGGHAPAADWLTGSPVGYQGPWGTSYPANLRLTVQSLTEAQWLVSARSQRRPPMPWFTLREMSDRDLTDMYRYIRSLGPAGVPAPAAVPPGGRVNTPYIVLEPQNPGARSLSQSASPQSEPRS
jgi:mono/diheme cytochrome c family protein